MIYAPGFILLGILLFWCYGALIRFSKHRSIRRASLNYDSLACGPREVLKPWGKEIIWAENELYVGKILRIQRHRRLSLQYHDKKDETLYVASGVLELYMEKKGVKFRTHLHPGDCCRIRPHTIHRMRAVEDCDVYEVSSPELTDVVRLEDDYKRI